MIERDQAEVDRGTPINCEASYSYNGLYWPPSILLRKTGGPAGLGDLVT